MGGSPGVPLRDLFGVEGLPFSVQGVNNRLKEGFVRTLARLTDLEMLSSLRFNGLKDQLEVRMIGVSGSGLNRRAEFLHTGRPSPEQLSPYATSRLRSGLSIQISNKPEALRAHKHPM